MAGYQFVLFEQLGGAHGARCACSTSLPATGTMQPHHNGEIAMPRRWKILIFLTALLATTLSFASFASAKTDNVTVLHLTGQTVEDDFIDVAPTGGPPTLGDMFLGSEDLFRDGRKVGFSGIVCTAVRTQHPPAAFECVITAHLPEGDVTVQGFSFDQPVNTFAITGGTKRWRNAGGQVVARDVNETTTKITAYISDLG
jgi:hypothetical protein